MAEALLCTSFWPPSLASAGSADRRPLSVWPAPLSSPYSSESSSSFTPIDDSSRSHSTKKRAVTTPWPSILPPPALLNSYRRAHAAPLVMKMTATRKPRLSAFEQSNAASRSKAFGSPGATRPTEAVAMDPLHPPPGGNNLSHGNLLSAIASLQAVNLRAAIEPRHRIRKR